MWFSLLYKSRYSVETAVKTKPKYINLFTEIRFSNTRVCLTLKNTFATDRGFTFFRIFEFVRRSCKFLSKHRILRHNFLRQTARTN